MARGVPAWCWCPGCAPRAAPCGLGCCSAATAIDVPNRGGTPRGPRSIGIRDREMGPFVALPSEPPATAGGVSRLQSHVGSVVRAPAAASPVLSPPGRGSLPVLPALQ